MKLPKKNSMMLLALMCVLAVGAGTYGAVRQSVGNIRSETYARLTVPSAQEQTSENRVNAPVTGIVDERTTATRPQTTANVPYSGSFALPMGNNVIKDYSNGEMVFSETMGDWRVHSGVDFGGSAGNDVLAVADGIVTAVYTDSFKGTVIEIDHGNSMTVKYCGLQSKTAVREGAAVSKFERIGSLGHIPEELADGDHLHLEVAIEGITVDPLRALNKLDLRQATAG